MTQPENDLERALWAAARGPEAYPELFRRLRECEVTFLVPYHPEMEGEIKIKNGTSITFTVWQNNAGRQIPVFTSVERAEAALKAVGAKEKNTVMEGVGEAVFAMIADGSILKQQDSHPESGRIKIVDPAEYPSELLAAVHQYLRTQPQVRAGWLFYRMAGDQPENRYYVFGLLLTGDVERIKGEVTVVVRHAKKGDQEFGVTDLDANHPGMGKIMREFPPFYAAADYKGV